MEFVDQEVKSKLIINNAQFSAKMQTPELELAQQALQKLSPESRKLLATNEEGTVTHRSFLNAMLFQIVNSTDNGYDVAAIKSDYDAIIAEKDQVINVHLDTIQNLAERINKLTEDANNYAEYANKSAYDANEYILLEKNIIQLQDFFISFEKRKEAGMNKTIEGFLYQVYAKLMEMIPAADRAKNNLIYTPENYK